MALKWTFGGNGSHWNGCYSVHIDCALEMARYLLENVSMLDNIDDKLEILEFLERTKPTTSEDDLS